ncbi:hypothetical protein LTS18_011003 [Coniosporium uncinatum]|uniref:Uncharacterized protein n=1 Tax=Coniosporium uncinatum TaxID=93489 RepID=A0ACC3DW51_9PEZI|nr:hypothetical protein LTS18_011003 [Coniosporium uncinatum]
MSEMPWICHKCHTLHLADDDFCDGHLGPNARGDYFRCNHTLCQDCTVQSIEEQPTPQMKNGVAALKARRTAQHDWRKRMHAPSKTAAAVQSGLEGDEDQKSEYTNKEKEDQEFYYSDPRFSNSSQTQRALNAINKISGEPVNMRSEIPALGTVSMLRQVYEPNQDRLAQEISINNPKAPLQTSQFQTTIGQIRKQSMMGMFGRLAQSQSTSRPPKTMQHEYIPARAAPPRKKRPYREQLPEDQDELAIDTTQDKKSEKCEKGKRRRIMISETPEGAEDEY